MGFTKHEKNTYEPHIAGSEIQSFVGMINFISWGVSVYKKIPQKIIGSF